MNLRVKKVEFSRIVNSCQAFNSFHACRRYIPNRQVYRDQWMESKHHDEYQYSPLEAALSKFFSLLWVFFSTFWLVKKQQWSARFRCLKRHTFCARVEENMICTYGWTHFLPRAICRSCLRSRASAALSTY